MLSMGYLSLSLESISNYDKTVNASLYTRKKKKADEKAYTVFQLLR